MAKTLNPHQAKFLSLLTVRALPSMISDRVINDLRSNLGLWSARMVEKKGTWKGENSRSISMLDSMNSLGKQDSLSIRSTNADNNKLFTIAKEWEADKIGWKEKRSDSENEPACLDLRWDYKL